jgi:hypothetical protein
MQTRRSPVEAERRRLVPRLTDYWRGGSAAPGSCSGAYKEMARTGQRARQQKDKDTIPRSLQICFSKESRPALRPAKPPV